MWFEHAILRASGAVEEVTVGDTVFTGATVPWDALTRAERAWVAEQLQRAFLIWHPVADPDTIAAWRLHSLRQGRAATPGLAWTLDGEAWHEAAPWEALQPPDQAAIQAQLHGALEAIYALLIIH